MAPPLLLKTTEYLVPGCRVMPEAAALTQPEPAAPDHDGDVE